MFTSALRCSYLLLILIALLVGCSDGPVDQIPSFPKEHGLLKLWLAEHTNYPQEAVDLGIEGRVVVGFTVSKDGEIKNVAVKEFVHPLLDKEALRVVKSMPRWNPEIVNGKPINSIFSLPISFKLQ